MAKKAKRAEGLTDLEKQYLDLYVQNIIETRGNVSERDLEGAAALVKKDLQLVKNYVNIVTSQNEPKLVDKVPASPQAAEIRKQFSPREGMAMMNPNLSEVIDKNPANFKTPSRYDNVIYRGNPK